MTFLQLFAIVFALFALSRVILRAYKHQITGKEFLFWTIVWTILIIVALRPETTTLVATISGVERGADVALFVAVILIFYLIFRLYVKIEQVEHDLTKIVRNTALEKIIEKKK